MRIARARRAGLGMRFLAERFRVRIGRIARIGTVVVGIGSLGGARLADRCVQGMVRLGVARNVPRVVPLRLWKAAYRLAGLRLSRLSGFALRSLVVALVRLTALAHSLTSSSRGRSSASANRRNPP